MLYWKCMNICIHFLLSLRNNSKIVLGLKVGARQEFELNHFAKGTP